ncbi:hypothetical protein [Chlorobium sp. N1]|uniref:hypothetical protein n=1 Tax=Chlorobium sp. N1 TaxID=2491138 RepID=UPI00103C66A9|nr:hypothetical protein [Chlorobium sp. N1]TCD47200.1 hypothetical protein E0L29_08880 [Chlorobium sp. N1]
MNTERAEAVLMDAMAKYAEENPGQKAELIEALDAILEKTARATSIAMECNKGLMECMEMVGSCPLSIVKIS